jgi:hypothetical protein
LSGDNEDPLKSKFDLISLNNSTKELILSLVNPSLPCGLDLSSLEPLKTQFLFIIFSKLSLLIEVKNFSNSI